MNLIKKILITLGVFFTIPTIMIIRSELGGTFWTVTINGSPLYTYFVFLKTFYQIPIIIIGIILAVHYFRKWRLSNNRQAKYGSSHD